MRLKMSFYNYKTDARTHLVLIEIVERNIAGRTKVVKFSVIENRGSSFSNLDDFLLFYRESPRLASRAFVLRFQKV